MNSFYPTQNHPINEDLKRLMIAYASHPTNNSLNPFRITINSPLTEPDIILNQFDVRNWRIINRREVSAFLNANPDIAINLRETIIFIPKLIKKTFIFKLKLEKDPEAEDFETLQLVIVGEFKPKEAFGLLQRIDREWLFKNVSDITKFNVNIEFL